MNIQEIIKTKRLQRKLTQEEVAKALGVSTPAVNKWEKGSSYPDITLLPALARLLETDLNTLLSFQGDLSDTEIANFLNELSAMGKTAEFDEVYQTAMQKIREYPSSYLLIVSVAVVLDGFLAMASMDQEEKTKAEAEVEQLYERSLASDQPRVYTQAQRMLIARYMNRHEYEKAEELLREIPEQLPFDKKQLQANLCAAQGQTKEAARLLEEKLLVTVQETQNALLALMELALKDQRYDDALAIADASRDAAHIFHQWEYASYIAHFEYYVKRGDADKTMELLPPLLASVGKPWNIKVSPLYRHLKTKELNVEFQKVVQKNIVEALLHEEETAFLREHPSFSEILKNYQ